LNKRLGRLFPEFRFAKLHVGCEGIEQAPLALVTDEGSRKKIIVLKKSDAYRKAFFYPLSGTAGGA
jgi:hypothetical protein